MDQGSCKTLWQRTCRPTSTTGEWNNELAVSFDNEKCSDSRINGRNCMEMGNEWKEITKGTVCKMFFPNIKDRLNTKPHMTPNFTAILT